MIYTITIILSTLVIANFLLLKFSCNKTKKSLNKKKETISINQPIAQQNISIQLAATGS